MYSQYDKQYGIQKEKELKPFLVKHFGALSETPPNDIFDFYNKKYTIEVKSRRVGINTYPSQMVGLNKVEAGKRIIENGKVVLFVFNLTDGVYYWIQNDNYKTRIGGRCDRGRPEYKQYCYVDRKDLIHLEEEP